jgi:hypothetical protein
MRSPIFSGITYTTGRTVGFETAERIKAATCSEGSGAGPGAGVAVASGTFVLNDELTIGAGFTGSDTD